MKKKVRENKYYKIRNEILEWREGKRTDKSREEKDNKGKKKGK